jgi:hypothetical protein
MSDAADQPILILGMHRSGTSFLANLMQSMGVHIGDDLVGPQKGNLRGHFEARHLLEFHEALIARRDSSQRKAFDQGMLVQEPFEPDFSKAERTEAKALIDALRQSGPWGWKEPRTCLFLDLWRELLPGARPLVVYRHPLEVQQSMLRRSHWDLALFQDQAMQAYVVYNEAILKGAGEGYVFNANAGFMDLPALTGALEKHFDLTPSATLPEFHAGEFKTIPLSRALHDLFALFHPEAAAVFDQLQARADIPYEWETRDDDESLAALSRSLQPLVEGMPASGRAAFTPLLDWWASGKDATIFPLYEELAREIGEHIRKVKQWNEEAAVIYKDNERLSADYEKMGTDYAKQQEFLAKQAATQAKVWEELKRTGDSWKEQKAFIDNVLKEKQAMLAELQALKDKLAALENPEA